MTLFLSPEKGVGGWILISYGLAVGAASLFEEDGVEIFGLGSNSSGASSNKPTELQSVSVSVLSESESVGARNVLLVLDVVVSTLSVSSSVQVQFSDTQLVASCIKGAQGLSTCLAQFSFGSFVRLGSR